MRKLSVHLQESVWIRMVPCTSVIFIIIEFKYFDVHSVFLEQLLTVIGRGRGQGRWNMGLGRAGAGAMEYGSRCIRYSLPRT